MTATTESIPRVNDNVSICFSPFLYMSKNLHSSSRGRNRTCTISVLSLHLTFDVDINMRFRHPTFNCSQNRIRTCDVVFVSRTVNLFSFNAWSVGPIYYLTMLLVFPSCQPLHVPDSIIWVTATYRYTFFASHRCVGFMCSQNRIRTCTFRAAPFVFTVSPPD